MRGQTEFQVNLKLGLTPCPPFGRYVPHDFYAPWVTYPDEEQLFPNQRGVLQPTW